MTTSAELLGDEDIKDYLRTQAKIERDIMRPLGSAASTLAQRRDAISHMTKPPERRIGFMEAIGLIHGPGAVRYYEQYYRQARSDQGVDDE